MKWSRLIGSPARNAKASDPPRDGATEHASQASDRVSSFIHL